jgi:DNA-binding MarR family transcriptional regulator
MTTRLHRLERAGLVERTPDPADGRGVLVRLTPDGRRLAGRAREAILAADRAFLDPLDEHRRDDVTAGLRTLLLHAEQQERT